jgi:transcriptional regulator of NAD metabolism
LDERTACDHFLGKSLDEAEALFREASIIYQEDLMFMGASAFRFYVQGAISYIRSDSAIGDSDIISCFASILEQGLEYEPEELRPITGHLASICGYIIEHYDRFDLTAEIYGDIRPRYRVLQQAFLGQMESERR